MLDLSDFTAADILAAAEDDPIIARWLEAELQPKGLRTFKPRADNPDMGDEQWSFVYDQLPGVAIVTKGNGSGGSSAAAFKTARFLLELQPPPRPGCGFWVLGPKLDQVAEMAWCEKLSQGLIPASEIQHGRVEWQSAKGGRPRRIPLKPWPEPPANHPRRGQWHPDAYYTIELRSYEEGRQMLQASSIAGAWFSELCSMEILLEVVRGLRDYNFSGACFLECTPIDPGLSVELQKVLDALPAGWKRYSLNTECNLSLAPGWLESFKGATPTEMLPTRLRGEIANFEGAIYSEFNTKTHVVKDDFAAKFLAQPGISHFRGVDWGSSPQHATVVSFLARDQQGNWTVLCRSLQHRPGQGPFRLRRGSHPPKPPMGLSVAEGDCHANTSEPGDCRRRVAAGGISRDDAPGPCRLRPKPPNPCTPRPGLRADILRLGPLRH